MTDSIFIECDFTTCDHIHWNAMTFHAFENVEIASVVMRLGRDDSSLVGIPDNHVSVRSDGDATLANKSLIFMQPWRITDL